MTVVKVVCFWNQGSHLIVITILLIFISFQLQGVYEVKF